MLSAVSAVMTLHIHKLQEHIIHSSALQNAQLITNTISEFRTLYTSEVIETIQDHGIPVTHDYQRGKSVPLPASFSMLLGEKIGQSGNGAKSSLYSPYPFPWRSENGGLKDDFAKRAWQTLLDKSKDFYYEFAEQNGIETIRYTRADRMHEACISCHNNHPDSPKHDWKTGDLRGLLEVSIPLNKATVITHNDIELTIIIFLVLTLLGVYGMYRIFTDHSSFTKTLENAVVERTLQLEKEKQKAEQANQAKTQFLARMSHELRTPMNSILGFGQLLELDLKEEEQKKNCQQILSAGKHLLDLINEILDLELIETGKIPYQIESIDLDTVIKESLALTSSYAHQNNIQINDYIDCNLKALADYRLTKQIMVNLISNAIKYNRKNGTVIINIEPGHENTVRISVKDTGEGLTNNQLEKLFQPFERLDADKKCIEGVGIGLVITKRLTELMNGEIGVESTPGKGSTFWIELKSEQINKTSN